MYLERDAFRIAYDCGEVDVERIIGRIRQLGYKPHEIEFEDSRDERPRFSLRDLPEPVRTEAEAAEARSELLFLDFYADWCGPCKVLERNVLSATKVQEALEDFRFVKVDTDRFPAVAKHFGIVGLPTLIALDESGSERFRHLGPITTDALLKLLNDSKRSQSERR